MSLAELPIEVEGRAILSEAVKQQQITQISPKNMMSKKLQKYYKQGSGAEDSVGPHSGRPVLLWPTMKIWIVCFHF